MRLFRKWRRYLRRSDGMSVEVSDGVSEDMDDAMGDYRTEDNLEAINVWQNNLKIRHA